MTLILDTRGSICPVPLLKTKQALKKLPSEERLQIWVDDKASLADLRLLFKTLKIDLVEAADTPQGYYFLVQQKASTC